MNSSKLVFSEVLVFLFSTLSVSINLQLTLRKKSISQEKKLVKKIPRNFPVNTSDQYIDLNMLPYDTVFYSSHGYLIVTCGRNNMECVPVIK